MSDIRFHNFPSTTTIMQTCSKCDDNLLYTNSAQEYFIDTITFTNVTGKYLFMNGQRRDIIYVTDDSLSTPFDGGSRTSATIVWNYPHLAEETNCLGATTPSEWDNALLCD